MNKDITVAIPVYERPDYVKEAIDSALNQTIKPVILVIDNASSHDGFKDIVASYKDPDIQYVRNDENVGMVSNWNRCLELPKTKWLTILHDDDVLHPEFLEKTYQFAQTKPNAVAVSVECLVDTYIPDSFWFPAQKKPTILEVQKPFFLFKNLTPYPGVLINKEKLSDDNRFMPPNHPISDLYFWALLLDKGEMYLMVEKLAYYRISDKQETVHTVTGLIDHTFEFRKNYYDKLHSKGFLLKLTCQRANLHFIIYFKKKYKLNTLEDYINKVPYKGLLENNFVNRALDKYRRTVSYKKIQ